MPLKNTLASYGWLAKSFHWVVAVLIIGMLIVGNVMVRMEEGNPNIYPIYNLHKSTGVLVLVLVIARFCWRVISVEPSHAQLPTWQRFLSTAVHYALYVCMFAMPISGWGMSSAAGYPVQFFGLFSLPPLVEKNKSLGELFAMTHGWVSWILIALLCAHIGAALLHHFYYKDNILKRMLP